MAVNLPDCPASLKSIQHYLKAAVEHDSRDPVVSYWCRLYALQVGLKISSHQPDETKLLIGVMDWLETRKKDLADNEAVTNDVAAQAHLENYALKLFMYADKQDRESNFGKNVVKSFYTAGLIYDVLQTFGELTDEAAQNRKYAKWKAAYIHNCLKNGETPVPGPMQGEDGSDEVSGNDEANEPGPSLYQNPTTPSPGGSHPGYPPAPNFGFQNPPPGTSGDFETPRLPSPPAEPEKPPGGFQPYVPPVGEVNIYQPTPIVAPVANVQLTAEQITKAQKYCKWAASALTYDDIKTAIENLQKGLNLLQTGQDS